jgi:hypothetical protein
MDPIFLTFAVLHVLMSWLNALALENIDCMSVTAAVFQLPIFSLNTLALANMDAILSTLTVLHALMSWLNALAFENIDDMSVTAAVFHALMSWLNVLAFENIDDMSVTAVVFQLPMLALNSARPLNSDDISFTWLVSQDVMGSYTAAPQSIDGDVQSHAPLGALFRQVFTAVASAAPFANGPGPSQALAGPSFAPPMLDVRLYRVNHAVAPKNILSDEASDAPVHPVMSD